MGKSCEMEAVYCFKNDHDEALNMLHRYGVHVGKEEDVTMKIKGKILKNKVELVKFDSLVVEFPDDPALNNLLSDGWSVIESWCMFYGIYVNRRMFHKNCMNCEICERRKTPLLIPVDICGK